GDFLGITQDGAGLPVGVSSDRPQIPAGRLAWYVNDREGSAWYGKSILRPSFGPWLLKQEALRVHATSLRRFGAGTPVMEPLPGTNPTGAQVEAAARAARAVRVGDTGGAATPGFTLRIKGVEGTIPDALPFLRFLNEEMRVSVLQSVLDLASSPNGSRALGDTFMGLLGMALQSVADMIAATATQQIATRITDYTDGEGAAVPRIVIGDVASDEDALAAIVEPLVKSGAITPDPALEGFLRERYRLPAKVIDTAPTPAPVPAPVPVAAARGGAPKVGARAVQTPPAWPYTRPLTAVEAAAGLDPQALDDANAAVAAAVLAAWPGIFAAQRDDLVAQIDAALARGDVAALTTLTVDTTAAEDVLANAVLDAAQAGIDTAVAEAATAGVTIDPAAVDVDTVALDTWARTVARSMGEGLAASAGAEASRLAGPASTPGEVSAQVGTFLDGLSDVTVRDRVNGVIEGGMGSGRAAAAKAAPAAAGAPVFTHSAVRDSGTCIAPDTLVSTERGHVAAKDVTLDDRLLTHAGRYVHPEGIVVSEVNEQIVHLHVDGRVLALTHDHPVYVRAGAGFEWRDAGQVAVGDLVVSEATVKGPGEPVGHDLNLGETPDGEALGFERGSLPGVHVRAQGVPVGAVSLDDERVADEEVHGPSTDGGLLGVGVALDGERLADKALDGRLAGERLVAGVGAEPPFVDVRRSDALRLPAVVAGDEVDRAAAELGAVGAPRAGGVREMGAAPLALSGAGTVVHAGLAAPLVPVGGRGLGEEPLPADLALTDDTRPTLAADGAVPVGVSGHARAGAVDLLLPVDAGVLNAAGLAEPRRLLSHVRRAPEADRAGLAADRFGGLQNGTAVEAFGHESIVLQRVSLIERRAYAGEVFDFTIPGDHTFWAEGVLVHNCDVCAAQDGHRYADQADAEANFPTGGYAHCLGRFRCRCLIVTQWPDAASGGAGA
ncbi:MAG TPA: hypothetical protein PKL08_00760, partial [Thermoanaerobaculaceae bacterium]|nr:hypothetical protein [Thermoanaerobaculaceae bacterium]